MRLVIAARKSDLARLQAERVGRALAEADPRLEIKFHFRESLGDLNQANALWEMPAKGVFTEDFVGGLESGEFDLVVHSWKDLPTENRAKTEIVATMNRADARDVLLVHRNSFQSPRKTWRVLSSSPRRAYFLGSAWKDLAPPEAPALEFQAVRGNIPTRLTKLRQGEGEALLVAKAALDRLLSSTEDEFAKARETLRAVLDECEWMVLPLSLEPPAPAQGALAIEIKKGREDLRALLAKIHSAETFEDVEWEREQLSSFGGGCHLQLGALATRKSGAKIRVLRGQPPGKEPIAKLWIERAHSASAKFAADLLCVPRSEDFFEVEKIDAPLNGDAFYVAHRRALPTALPEDCRLWTAGLKTWRELARLGYWVSGSDESWGESRPDVDVLAGKKLEWKKLTHDQAPADQMPVIATYGLRPRTSLDPEFVKGLTRAHAFFWRSGSLFERAWELFPGLHLAHHSCGLGATRSALEKKLGPLADSQVFLDESEWRMFYCPQDSLSKGN